MWPKLLDMSRDECKRLLRRMELEAYAGIVSAFRAQGALNEEKKKMLNDLCNMLSISTERHRAEIRRAVNDEKYATIAEHLEGSNTGAEWAIEGRRLIPLLPRLVPQTTFTIAANQAANMAHVHNMSLLPPSETSTKRDVSPPTSSSSSANGKPARCLSPNSGMVVLPSGLSIPIKSPSDLSDNENTLPPPPKRKRSNSSSSALKSDLAPSSAMMGGMPTIPSPKPSSSMYTAGSAPSTSKITTGYVTQSMHGAPSGGQGSPVKITFTKGSGTASQQSVPLNSAQKVIIVSSGNTSYNSPTILQQRSHHASRALSTMSSGMHHVSAVSKQPVVLTTMAGGQHSSHHGMMHHGLAGSAAMGTAAVKSFTSPSSSSLHEPSMHGAVPSYQHNPSAIQHPMPRGPRPKTYSKQKVVKPFSIISGSAGGGVAHSGIAGGITMTTPSPTAAGKKPTIHIKQESAGVKIITQTMAGSGKMVPKPITITTTSGGSVVMVTCVPSSSMVMTGNPIVTSGGGTIIHQGGQVRSVYGTGTRYVTGPAGMHGGAKPSIPGSNVITVSPRALQTALAKGATPSTVVVSKPSSHMGSSGKANVIVVQKSQMMNPKAVSIQRSLSAPEVHKHLMTGTSSLLTRPKISMVTTTSSLSSSVMSPTVRYPVPPHQRGQHGGVTMATTMTMTPVASGGHQMPGPTSSAVVSGGKVPMTVGVMGSPKAGQDITSRAAQVVIRSKTSLSQPGQPLTRRRSGSPASSASFLEYPSQLNPNEGERLARVTVQRRSASVSPTGGQSSTGMVIDDAGTVTRLTSHDPPGQQVPMLFHTTSGSRQLPNREWIDYDGNPPEQSASSAIKALLEFRAQPQSSDVSKQKQTTSLDLSHLGKVSLNQITKTTTMATHASATGKLATQVSSTGKPMMSQHITVKKGGAIAGPFPSPMRPVTQQKGGAITSPVQPIIQQQKGGAITGPLPGPPRPVIQQRTNVPLTTTSPSVFTGSHTMMSTQQFRGKQVFTDMKRNTSFLQSATMEVEKALQEQNKAHQQPKVIEGAITQTPRGTQGAITSKAPSRGMELSATLPRLTHPITIPAAKATHQQVQRPNKPSNIVTIEEQGVVSEHMELSPAEVNSFIDQFERFLESEGLESEMEGSEKLMAVARSQREKAESMERKGKAVTIQVPKPGVAATAPGEQPLRKPGHEVQQAVIKKVIPSVTSRSSSLVPAAVSSVSSTLMASGSLSSAGPSGPSESKLTWQETYTKSLQQKQVIQKPPTVPQPIVQPPVIKPPITQTNPSGISAVPAVTTAVTTVESAVVVGGQLKHPSPFSTLHEMLSKGKGATVIEPVATASSTTASATAVVQTAPPSGQAKPVTTSVVVESSRFDASQMNMEDFTSQRLQDDFDVAAVKQDDIPSVSSSPTPSQKSPGRSEGVDVSLAGSGGSQSEESVSSLDAQLGIRSSKRKRKAPVPIDEDVGPMCMPSWARAALNLLHRVMRFRGANRSKGDLNAASWFTRPVDPSEAPGYMQLIKIPMDFSTIKKKLENNQYNDLSEFHNDMMLVRGNCHLYNPPGHEARKDCEEVFQFYTAEYGKVLDRMQKALLFNTPRSPKKTKDGSSSPGSSSSPVSSPISALARSTTPPASTSGTSKASTPISPTKTSA